MCFRCQSYMSENDILKAKDKKEGRNEDVEGRGEVGFLGFFFRGGGGVGRRVGRFCLEGKGGGLD